jgi:hypothetical protein
MPLSKKKKHCTIDGQGRFCENIRYISSSFMELLPLKFSRLRDLDHDARVDLINEGDTSSPDPVHSRELALNIHHENIMREGDVLRSKGHQVFCISKGGQAKSENESQEKAGALVT